MIRRCVICRKQKEPYHLLRLYIDKNKILRIYPLRSYQPSIRTLHHNNAHPKSKKNAWVCLQKSCIKNLLQNPKKVQPTFQTEAVFTHFISEIQTVFSSEFLKYINHLSRQGGITFLQNNLDELLTDETKFFDIVLIHKNMSDIQKNEIVVLDLNKKTFAYKEIFSKNNRYCNTHIGLHDHSKRKKYHTRRQRIQTILEIWAILRYID